MPEKTRWIFTISVKLSETPMKTSTFFFSWTKIGHYRLEDLDTLLALKARYWFSTRNNDGFYSFRCLEGKRIKYQMQEDKRKIICLRLWDKNQNGKRTVLKVYGQLGVQFGSVSDGFSTKKRFTQQDCLQKLWITMKSSSNPRNFNASILNPAKCWRQNLIRVKMI